METAEWGGSLWREAGRSSQTCVSPSGLGAAQVRGLQPGELTGVPTHALGRGNSEKSRLGVNPVRTCWALAEGHSLQVRVQGGGPVPR